MNNFGERRLTLPRQKGSRALAPKVRADFAKRLREQRVKRGYGKARSFARAIGIEENRYTRYERAEVEPDLTLIKRICDALRVTPDDLLGFSDPSNLALKQAMLSESLREDRVRLLLLLKQAHDHISLCLEIMTKFASAD